MKVALNLTLAQKQIFALAQQQAVKLLQLSGAELQTEIQAALDSNMMLEIDEQDGVETSLLEDGVTLEPAAIELDNIPSEPNEQEVWEDGIWDDDVGRHISLPKQTREAMDFRVNQVAAETSLQDHLFWQLNLVSVSETDNKISKAIIYALNDDGYLAFDLEQIKAGLADEIIDTSLEEVEAMLHLVQSFDPLGVAARNISECLLIQLNQRVVDSKYIDSVKQFIKYYLPMLAGRDYKGLMKVLGLTRPELKQIIAIIQSLNPKPGRQFASITGQYIIPDVYVKKRNGYWSVELSESVVQPLRINRDYSSLVKRADNGQDNLILKDHLKEARWLIKSIQDRNKTVLRVARYIVEKQIDFFEHGEVAMKPMVLKEVASVLELHESTISRVTTNKYMDTPLGMFEFKYFFSRQLGEGDAGHSAIAVRSLIKNLILNEDSRKPLSDCKIERLLSNQGIQVARRTIAKYREAMAIPTSSKRKRRFNQYL